LAIWPGLWNTNSRCVAAVPNPQVEFAEIASFGALHTLNLLFTKTVGNNSTESTQFNPAWQSRLLINPLFAPGFEYYGQIDEILNRPVGQQHRIGPVLIGQHNLRHTAS
jgi:hypothetical protein